MTGRPDMFGRLSTQVFVVSIGVAVVAAVLTGALVRDRTIDAFEQAVERDLATDSAIYGSVSQFPFFFESWSEGQGELEALSDHFSERIAITSLDGLTVLADSDVGADLPNDAAAVLVSDPFGTDYTEDVLALCLGQAEPLNIAADAEDIAADAEDIAADAGILSGGITEAQIVEAELNDCLAESQVAPRANALLYLGYPSDPVDRGDLALDGLLLGGGGVLAIAGLGAVMLARRVSEPVAELTEAAGLLASGDLTQRVGSDGRGEIATLAKSFNDMAGRLEQTDESRRQLISDVAHELRNPIGVLQGNLEAAQDGVLPLDDDMVANLVSETRHLGQLVRDLQDINLAELRGLRIDQSPQDVLALCNDVVASYGAISPHHRLRCVGTTAYAHADGLRTRQVVENLVKNAITHTEPGGTVTVAVTHADAWIHLTVSDDGAGIAAEDLPHVFDRFWRADGSRARTTGGTGLGLSICAAIVEAHGGSLTVTSQPGVGTTFRASLPAAIAPDANYVPAAHPTHP